MSKPIRDGDQGRNAVWQGTLSLMILRTLQTMGEQHGYGIARRIEQTSGGRLTINYGTLYPALLKLEQEGLVSAAWGLSDNGRKARFYKLTRAGRKQIERETKQWEATSAIMSRFLATEDR
jgi:transcriptional regulator